MAGGAPPVTSPTSAGSVSVEVIADASKLAKDMRSKVEAAFRGLDFSKAIQDSVGTEPIKVPVEADAKAFTSKLKAETAAAARAARTSVKVDVDVDRDAIGRSLGGGAVSLLGRIASGFAQVTAVAGEAAGSAVRFGGSLAGAATTASGPVGLVIGAVVALGAAIGGLAAAATFAAPALSVLGGALAALPGLLAGAGAGFGTLALGFKGISDAFKPKAGGGGGGGGGGEDPASRARRIAGAERGVEAARRGIAAATRGLQSANRSLEDAERGVGEAQQRVTDAQKRALQAQQAVNRARREAKEDIEDLGRALRGASLDEEDAALRLTEAERALNLAREQGNLPDIQRAELEYRQAQLAVENAKDATEDLGEAAKEANDKGIEGSDKVQDALRDQVEANRAVSDAIQGVADAQVSVIDAQNGVLSANDALKSSYDGLASAQDSLAEAQKKAASAGGGGGGLKDIVKLAPEAERFVAAAKALKPAFEKLRLDVQNRLFKNLDDTVRRVGKAWIPALTETLGSYADTFNKFFRNLGTSITQPKFIKDLQIGAEAGREAFAAIGSSITTSLVPAFGALSRASAPFIKTLGKEIAGIVTEFSNWILKAEKSKSLTSFFATASESLHDIFTTGKLVGKIIGNLFQIITGGGGTGKTGIDSFNDGLTQLNTYLSDPKNQQSIRDFFGSIVSAVADVGKIIKAFNGFVDKFRDVKKTLFGDDSGEASSAGASIGKALVAGIATGVKTGFETTWGIIAAVLWSGPDSLIGRIKSLLGIASPSTVMAEIGGWLIAGLAQGISDGVGSLLATVSSLPGIIRQGIGDAAKILVNAGRNVVMGLSNGIAALYGSLRTRAVGLKSTIVNVFSAASTFLANAGRNVVAGLANGITALYGTLRSRALGLRTTITNALSNAGTLLVNTGRNLVYGLWNGIASLGSWLRDRVIAFARATIPGPLHQFFGINSPSKLMFEMGGYVTEGLALGMESEARRVEQAASAIAAAALPQVADVGMDLTAAGDAAIRSSLAVAGANSLQASWAPGATGDKVLDAMRGLIKFSYGGSAEAALGSS